MQSASLVWESIGPIKIDPIGIVARDHARTADKETRGVSFDGCPIDFDRRVTGWAGIGSDAIIGNWRIAYTDVGSRSSTPNCGDPYVAVVGDHGIGDRRINRERSGAAGISGVKAEPRSIVLQLARLMLAVATAEVENGRRRIPYPESETSVFETKRAPPTPNGSNIIPATGKLLITLSRTFKLSPELKRIPVALATPTPLSDTPRILTLPLKAGMVIAAPLAGGAM